MNLNHRSANNPDDLLKAVLADDLPDDVAAGMRNRITAFRAGAGQRTKSAKVPAWLFRRGLWATLAILMLIAGFALQGLQARNPLADRIAQFKAEVSQQEARS
jgi:hypothetical protein